MNHSGRAQTVGGITLIKGECRERGVQRLLVLVVAVHFNLGVVRQREVTRVVESQSEADIFFEA